MTAAASAQTQPPEAELQFDIGSTDDSLERMLELFARLGDIYRVFVPARGSYTYVIHHPDDVKRVLVANHRNYTKGVGLDRVRILLGKGIMTSEGELWKRQRYMMQPLFHRRVLGGFAGVIAAANDRCIERWQALAMLMSARDRESGAPMGERELIDEVMTLIVAGHETTASGLNWTWYLLSQHPGVEARLHAEIDAASATPAPGLAQMEALTYTHQVVNEALRLYPPGWLLSRRTIEADVLGGYPVPAGANVLLPLYLLHRHPGFWKDPEAFSPERFAPEHEGERPRFAYMPFAAGPRHCIGETLALYEMLVHLYKVARHYRLKWVPDKPLELEAQINLRTRFPLHMRLERRR